jgi:UDP-glucose 4-epimerase
MAKFVVTGGAGFIGSHMTSRLLKNGHDVKVVDKISQDKAIRLQSVIDNNRFSYRQIDLSNSTDLVSEFKGHDTVIHFAASADISLGHKNTDLDLRQGTMVTYHVLEAMRLSRVKEIIFSSSSTVYGYPNKIPTSEDVGLLFPASLYGASKLASEALISAFCYLFDVKSWIFRFGNVIGGDTARGVIYDLVHKLKNNSDELEVLGNGEQLKDYINIDDCIDAMLYTHSKVTDRINAYNLSSGTTLSVKEVVNIILEEMNLNKTKIRYTGGPPGWDGGGWAGDVKIVHYDETKIKNIGWSPKLSSREAVRLAIRGTIQNS